MRTTVDDLRDEADRLMAALAAYDEFVEGWPYEHGPVPSAVDDFLTRHSGDVPDSVTEAGVALASAIEDLYHRAHDARAAYVQRASGRAHG